MDAPEDLAELVDDVCRDWSLVLGAPYGDASVSYTAAVGLLRDLGPSQSSSVLFHQDLHGDNVLAAAREPWLVIDPKPLVGEREFSAAPIDWCAKVVRWLLEP